MKIHALFEISLAPLTENPDYVAEFIIFKDIFHVFRYHELSRLKRIRLDTHLPVLVPDLMDIL